MESVLLGINRGIYTEAGEGGVGGFNAAEMEGRAGHPPVSLPFPPRMSDT